MKEDYSIQFDEYIKFDRKEAYLQYNDKKNRKVLRGILYAIATIFIISSFVTSISYIFDSDTSLLTVVISYIGFIISLFFLPSRQNREKMKGISPKKRDIMEYIKKYSSMSP